MIVLPGSMSQTRVKTFAKKNWHVQIFLTKIRHVQTLATEADMARPARPKLAISRNFGISRLSRPMSRRSRPILAGPDFHGPRRDSCPDFPDSNSRRD